MNRTSNNTLLNVSLVAAGAGAGALMTRRRSGTRRTTVRPSARRPGSDNRREVCR